MTVLRLRTSVRAHAMFCIVLFRRGGRITQKDYFCNIHGKFMASELPEQFLYTKFREFVFHALG